MFVLTSDISIGPYKRAKVHEVRINKSVHDFVNKAVIKLPTSARIVLDGNLLESSTNIANSFSEGALVKIDLGYNNVLKNEFVGFVSRVNFKSPLEVECEGYSYQLRKRTYKKVFKNAKLLEILKFLASGTDIVIDSKNIEDVVVTKLLLQDHSGTEALTLLKKMFDNIILFWFEGKVINASLFPAKPIGETVPYRIGWNVINADQLKKRESKNTDVEIIYQAREASGNVVTATGGRLKAFKTVAAVSSKTEGERKRINTSINNVATLKKMANSQHYKTTYDGYDGKITAFLVPFCLPAWSINLMDKKFKEREGKYIITGVEITYGINGARRILEIGNQI